MFFKSLIVFWLFFSSCHAAWTVYDLSGSVFMGENLLIKQNSTGYVIAAWNENNKVKASFWDGAKWTSAYLSDIFADYIKIYFADLNNNGKGLICWIESNSGSDRHKIMAGIWDGSTWSASDLSGAVGYISEYQFMLNEQNMAIVTWIQVNSQKNYSIMASVWQAAKWSTFLLSQEDCIMMKNLQMDLNGSNQSVISWISVKSQTDNVINSAIWSR